VEGWSTTNGPLTKYKVRVFGSNMPNTVHDERTMIDMNAELIKYMRSIQSVRKDLDTTPVTQNMAGFIETMEADFGGEIAKSSGIRCLFVSVDSALQFSVVPACNSEQRIHFLTKIHAWHKENKASLTPVFNSTSKPMKENSIVGMVCVFNTTLLEGGKWNRGIIIQNDSGKKLTVVYAVDHARPIMLPYDRLFELKSEEFLAEPIYVHRCLAQSSKEMHDQLIKYLELVKTSETTVTPVNTASNNQFSSPSSNTTGHLTIGNFDLEIKWLGKDVAPLNQSTTLYSRQHLVRITDIRRIRSPFLNVGSPFYSSLISQNNTRATTRVNLVQQQQMRGGGDMSPMSTTVINCVQSVTKTASYVNGNEKENVSNASIEAPRFINEHQASLTTVKTTTMLAVDNKDQRSKSPIEFNMSNQHSDTFDYISESTRIEPPNQTTSADIEDNSCSEQTLVASNCVNENFAKAKPANEVVVSKTRRNSLKETHFGNKFELALVYSAGCQN
jgi:hypothetical protein